MAFNTIPEYSTTAGTNTDISGVSVAEGWPSQNINNSIRALLAQLKEEIAVLDTVSSAATVDISSNGAFTVSGSTTITAFTVVAGSRRKLIFSGAPLLTHNATTLICPGGQNIQLAAGDVIEVVAHTTNQVTVVSYVPASGIPIAASSSAVSGRVLTANGAGVSPTWQALTVVGGGYAAKTADYTVISTDNGDVIEWTTAGFNANLTAAATLGAGFTVTLINNASTGNVTIDPDSAETLDGLATRVLRPGDRATIICTGSAWKTVRGLYSSAPAAITTGTADSFAHGFGSGASDFGAYMVAQGSPELGYTAGDKVNVADFQNGSSNARAVSVKADSTNVTITWGSSAPFLLDLSTFTAAAIDVSKWQIVLWVRM